MKKSEKIAMNVCGILAMVMLVVTVGIGGVRTAVGQEDSTDISEAVEIVEPSDDIVAPEEPEIETIVEETIEEPVTEYEEPVWQDDTIYYQEEEYYEPVYYAPEPAYSQPTEGLNSFTGVNYHDGRTETYYSSNVLYHQDTAQWHLDEEGFYRTDEGYYVVAASDMPQGTVFEGSKGECIVLDCGCAEGVTDYYVNW